LGYWRLRWLFSDRHDFLDEARDFQSVHGGESIERHVNVSSVLCFQPQALSNQNISGSRERDKKVPYRRVAANIFNCYHVALSSWRFRLDSLLINLGNKRGRFFPLTAFTGLAGLLFFPALLVLRETTRLFDAM